MLAKAGAVIPLDADPAPGNGVPNPLAVEVLVIAGADGAFELIEDGAAGIARTPLTWCHETGEMTIGPAVGDTVVLPAQRDWVITFPGGVRAQPADATIDGDRTEVAVRAGSAQVRAVPVGATLRIVYDQPVLRAGNDVAARVFELLDRAQIEYETKARVQDIVVAPHPLHVRVSYLQALRLSRDLESSICEILLADAS